MSYQGMGRENSRLTKARRELEELGHAEPKGAYLTPKERAAFLAFKRRMAEKDRQEPRDTRWDTWMK